MALFVFIKEPTLNKYVQSAVDSGMHRCKCIALISIDSCLNANLTAAAYIPPSRRLESALEIMCIVFHYRYKPIKKWKMDCLFDAFSRLWVYTSTKLRVCISFNVDHTLGKENEIHLVQN